MNHLTGAKLTLIYTRQCKLSFPGDFACHLHSLILCIGCQYFFCLLTLLPLPRLEKLTLDAARTTLINKRWQHENNEKL